MFPYRLWFYIYWIYKRERSWGNLSTFYSFRIAAHQISISEPQADLFFLMNHFSLFFLSLFFLKKIRIWLRSLFSLTTPRSRPLCVIIYNCNKRTLYYRASIGFRKVHNQFPISNIVTVLPCIGLVNPMDDLICLVKVGLNMEKTQKSLILTSFDGYLAFDMPPFLNALS